MLLNDPDLLQWPRLRKILDDIEEYRDPLPSKLTSHFFNALSSVRNILEVSFTTIHCLGILF